MQGRSHVLISGEDSLNCGHTSSQPTYGTTLIIQHHRSEGCKYTQFEDRRDQLLLLRCGDTKTNPGPGLDVHQDQKPPCECYAFDACISTECPCKASNSNCTPKCKCFEGNCNNMVSIFFSYIFFFKYIFNIVKGVNFHYHVIWI